MPEETAPAEATPAKLKADAKPDGWEKLTREGDPSGPATVGYDAKRHLNYHVNRAGEIIFHEVPAGFHFQAGELAPEESK